MKVWRNAFAILLGLALTGMAHAQKFPDRTVRFIVPWPAGGGADYVARTFASELSKVWGQAVIVENVTGAGSMVGAGRVANAAPDGYTLMMTTNGTVIANRFLYRQLPYDPDHSFVPVTMLVQSGQLVVVNADLPVSDIRALVELARKQPERVTYGSYGLGTQPHLTFETLNKRENVKLLHVPYKGLAPILTDLMSGVVNLTLVSPSSAAGAIKTGRVRPIAIGSDARSPLLPDVPTVSEAGYPYLFSTIWFGLFAPAGTPGGIVEKIHEDVVKITQHADFSKGLTDRGFDVVASDPAKFVASIKEEVERTREMVVTAGVRPE